MATEASQCYEPSTNGGGVTVERSSSALRSSIAKYGSNSYYYAHAPLPAAGENAKKIEGPGIVTGGPPTLLSSKKAEKKKIIKAKEAAAEAIEGKKINNVFSLKQYTWCDNAKNVKIYIYLNNLREGEENEGGFNEEQIAAEFNKDKLAVAIERPSGLYLLTINSTYGSIIPEESSVSVNENKIVVLLKKKDDLTWFSLSNN